ncbi:zinc finger protein 438 isoform X3 [Loxodonta africana]|uniref:zinc finger protein 438 isoform X3 n=1 Tax=Loxodonta africana TaxID=9785 RepID=UPI0030CC81FB
MKVTIQVKYIIMQNSLSVPPKDQGDSDSPPGTIQSRRGVQNKSQFRTIAPKIVPRALTSRVLPCHSPSFSDHLNPGPSINSKPLVMPSQNYALMQVAGQEGTFSLIALPHMASAQPIQKPRMPLPENLKLPIPRYQPPRNSKATEKKPSPSSLESSCSKPPVQTQTCPQMSSPRPIHPELPHKTLSSEQAPSRDEAPAALPSEGGLRALGPPLTPSRGDVNAPATLRSSTVQEPAVEQAHTRISETASWAGKKTCHKPSTVHLAKAMTSWSPAVFGNAVQMISSVPKGKLPILPYSRMKTTEFCKIKHIADLPLPGHRAHCDKISSIPEGFNVATKMADKIPVPQVSSRQSPCESAFCPAPKLDPNHKTKLNSGAARRRARKRKLPDEILTFQGKRRKCIINKCRNGKERVKTDPQEPRDQKPVKKYRSIMPKPVLVMPALASLASPAATLQSHTPGSLGQDAALNNSLTSEALGGKQNDSPSTKPILAFKNGRSGLGKPCHRCQVCNHHFEFRQHLQDHMSTHTNRRPYSCRICRKTYVRSGSLSTHMKLHHGESRPRRLLCCEFCTKVFSHVRVYFGHLKEVHRVVISTEPSPSEPQPGDTLKTRDSSVPGTEGSAQRENKSSLEEDLFLNQVDEVKLQIKCGRCQITTQSFAEIKFHLLYVHGEEIQGRPQEGLLPGSKGAQEELVRHAAPYWKQYPERRKLGKPCASGEDLHAFPKLKRQLYLHQRNNAQIQIKNEEAHLGNSELGEDSKGQMHPGPNMSLLYSHSGFNCLLCAQTLGRREDLLHHWEQQHNCEDPSKLWTILNAFCDGAGIQFSKEIEK